jgi:hypothetical protein
MMLPAALLGPVAKNGRQIAPAVQNVHNFNVVVGNPIKYNVRIYQDLAQTRHEIISRSSHERILPKAGTTFIDPAKLRARDFARGVAVKVNSNFRKIALRGRRPDKRAATLCHAGGACA